VVLVIEDNELNMMLFNDMLQASGYHVLQATNGMEGWRSACENHPDLIVMDIQLPDVSAF
jgi:two-component system cell cycle response regulator DivK